VNKTKVLLIVEDDMSHFDLILRSFSQKGSHFRLVRAQTLAAAQVQISNIVPDLVLIDYRLPDGDCFALVTELHNRIPVVVMTSHGNEQIAVDLLKAGAIDYVVKSEQSFAEMPLVIERAMQTWSQIAEKSTIDEQIRKSNFELSALLELRTKELQESRQNFSDLLNTAHLIMIRWTESGIIRYVNPYGLALFGYTEEEMHKSKVFFESDDPQDVRDQVFRKVSTNASAPVQIKMMRHMNGSPIWVAWTSHLVSSQNIQEREMLSIGIDVSENMRLQQDLAQAKDVAEIANRAKSEFLSNMGHNIRTPMNAILGMIHLAKQTSTETRILDYLQKAEGSAKALLRILNDILDYSRMESGHLILERAHFELDDLLSRVGDLYLSQAQEKGLEILYEVSPFVPHRLLGDPMRLGQVLMHLVSNAVKFTEQGVVRIQVELADTSPDASVRLRINVHDTGIGIGEIQKSKLFQAFQPGDHSISRRFNGSGLGLSICQSLVSLMQGRIWAESELGHGSIFHIEVLLERDQSVAVLHPHLAGIQNLQILVVDDNQVARDVLDSMLRSLDTRPTLAASGREAIEILTEAERRSEPFDMVLMDWRMPGLDGLQTLRLLQYKTRAGKHPSVVMVSATSRKEIEQRARGLPVDAILTKPFTFSQLLDVIQDVRGIGRSTLPAPFLTCEAPVNIKGARILLVDDNSMGRQVAQEMLQAAGASVACANDGLSALNMALAEPFDLIVMDCQMPVMDGYEATKRIRKEMKIGNVPILAMTASTLAEDRARCILAGMNEHISKPLDESQFLGAVSRWLNLPGSASPDVLMESNPFQWIIDPSGPEQILIHCGFALEQAITRLAGEWTIYRNMLAGYVQHQAQTPAEISKALTRGDTWKAIRLAHTLKGLAAFVGNHFVSNIAKTIEDKIGIVSLEETAVLIEELRLILSQSMESAAQYLQALGPVKANKNVDLLDMDELRRLLVSCDGAAVDLAKQFSNLYGEGEFGIFAQRVSQRAAKYDFDGALRALQKWQTSIKES